MLQVEATPFGMKYLSQFPDFVGFIPSFLSERDSRPAREQFDSAYAHGGGWHPMRGWKLNADFSITYPGDPAIHPVGKMKLRDETIYIYPYAWVNIVQADGSFEVGRMD